MKVWGWLGRELWRRSCVEARVGFGMGLLQAVCSFLPLPRPFWPVHALQLVFCGWAFWRVDGHCKRFNELSRGWDEQREAEDALTALEKYGRGASG